MFLQNVFISTHKSLFILEIALIFCYTYPLKKTGKFSFNEKGMDLIMKYQTKGTCSTSIDIEVENGKIKFVEFFGGCNGNLKGIASLVTGMNVDEAISKLKGIRCGFKTTSCPDQLAQALERIKQEGC